jgi:hypothetical protein
MAGGAVYAWKPPLVNAARKPGAWQSYDIIFERPRFAGDGKLLRPRLCHRAAERRRRPEPSGDAGHHRLAVEKYQAHGDAAPIQLQDHDSPVSFRNIWVRPLPPEAIAQDLPEDAR